MASSGAFGTSNSHINYRIDTVQNSQSIDGNSSNVTVNVVFYRTNTGYTTYGSGTVRCRIDGAVYSASVSTSQKITSAGVVLFSKNLNIGHNADGTKNLSVSAWISLNTPLTSGEQGFTTPLSTIPRASSPTLSKTTFDIGETITVHTNRVSGNFTHEIFIQRRDGLYYGSVAQNVADSWAWSTQEILAQQVPNSTQFTANLLLRTWNGGTLIGDKTVRFTANVPNNILPTISDVALSEAASGIPQGAGWVKSYSKIKAAVTAAGIWGSTISAYSVTVDGVEYPGQEIISNPLSAAGTVKVRAQVTDSRGRTIALTKTVAVNDYSPPDIKTFTADRCDADGTLNEQGEYLKLSYTVDITSLNSKNAKSGKLQYKKSTETRYTNINLSFDSYSVTGSQIIAADSGSSYSVLLTVTDSFSTSTASRNAATAYTIFNVKADGKGFAFGKVSERNGHEINEDVYLFKDIYTLNSASEFEKVSAVIVGAGADENYQWKKYSDGTMEVAGGFDVSDKQCNTNLGSWYKTVTLQAPEFPQTFISVPDVVMTFFAASSGTSAMVFAVGNAEVNKAPAINLIRPTVSESVSGRVSIVAKGRWKN